MRASRLSLELKSWSTKSASYRCCALDIVDEKLGKVFPLMKYIHHKRFFQSSKESSHYSCSCHHAQSLACKASLAKKITSVKNANNCCLPLLGGDCELPPSFLDIEDESSRISLHKDTSFLAVFNDFSSPRRVRRKLSAFKNARWRVFVARTASIVWEFQRTEDIIRRGVVAVKLKRFGRSGPSS